MQQKEDHAMGLLEICTLTSTIMLSLLRMEVFNGSKEERPLWRGKGRRQYFSHRRLENFKKYILQPANAQLCNSNDELLINVTFYV